MGSLPLLSFPREPFLALAQSSGAPSSTGPCGRTYSCSELRLLRLRDADDLLVGVPLNRGVAHLPANAALLPAAEGDVRAQRRVGVHPDGPGVDLRGDLRRLVRGAPDGAA